MLLQKGTRFAIGYGLVLITTMLLVVLLSSGQASLRIDNTGGTTISPSSSYGVPHSGDDILMGHPALQKYMPAKAQADEILKLLIAASSEQSIYFARYPIQYQAAPNSHHDKGSDQSTTEL